MRELLRRANFQKAAGTWNDELPTIAKQYSNRKHSSSNITPIQGSSEKNEVYVQKSLLDKRKKIKAKVHVCNLVRVADLKRGFSKTDTTNWFYKLF